MHAIFLAPVGVLVGLSAVLYIPWLIVAWLIDIFSAQSAADTLYPFVIKIDWIIGGIFVVSLGMLILYGVTMVRIDSRTRIVKGMVVFLFFCATTGLIVGAFWVGMMQQDSHWIVLNQDSFSQQQVSITEGDTIRFANPSSGIEQRLCLASHFECTTMNDGPTELQAPGIAVEPGDTLHVSFPTAGTYQVLASNVPATLLTIHVNVPSPPVDGGDDIFFALTH